MTPTPPTLIITHRDPDLDAAGFVYSARKVFGEAVPAKCRFPTRTELDAPAVIVGDIGLVGAEDIGYSPTLNNFDHHHSQAERSATWLFNQAYHALREDIVAYIDAVDTQGLIETTEFTLNVAIAGIRVARRGECLPTLEDGSAVLRWIEDSGQDPANLEGPFPDAVARHLQTGAEEIRRIEAEMGTLEQSVTASKHRLGFVVSRSAVISLVKERMFALGVEVVVVYNPARRRYSIACNQTRLKVLDLRATGIVEVLDDLEREHGLPAGDAGWGGHADRIGGPRPDGSFLSPEEILTVVQTKL